MIELRIAFQPKQKQFSSAIDQYPVTLYGGARGGGKSFSLRNIFLLRRFKYPGSTGTIFRRTYPELEANHIRPMFQQFPQLHEYWNESKKLLTLPTFPRSTLQFSHCANEGDVALQQGREIHDLGIDEAGAWLEGMFRTLQGSNRSSNPNIPARCALTANPGGIGHSWLKRLFIDRRYNERERGTDYNFIQALIADNPALMESDPDYVHRLNAEPNAALRKAYLYGDWEVHAGQFFQEITKEVHFIPGFTIPSHWNRFGAYDYGFNHPASFGWYATDEDGNTYKYRELVKAGKRVDEFAKELAAYPDTAKLYPIVAGRDCWTQKSTLRDDKQPPTVAEQFRTHGINLVPAVVDRIQGAAQLRDYLAWRGKPGGKPRFFVFDTCPITFDTLSRMIHDPDNVEDVLKVDATEGDPLSGDDAYDETRYGLMSRPTITDPVMPRIVRGTPAWHARMNENLFDQALEHHKKAQEEQGAWPDMPPMSDEPMGW